MQPALCLLAALVAVGCASAPIARNPAKQYPEMNRPDIVAKWGYPAEVLIKKSDPKLGTDIVTWIYYIQDTDGTVSSVFFNFRHGESQSSN